MRRNGRDIVCHLLQHPARLFDRCSLRHIEDYLELRLVIKWQHFHDNQLNCDQPNRDDNRSRYTAEQPPACSCTLFATKKRTNDSLEELAYCAQEDIAGIEGLDEEVAQELQKRARNVLLDQALHQGEEEGEAKISLLDLTGMTREIAEQMAFREMVTVDALADAAVDEIEDIEGLSREQAEALIITAREASGWFD